MLSKTEMDPCHRLSYGKAAGRHSHFPTAKQEDEEEVMCLWWLMAVDKGSVTNMGNVSACIYFKLFFPHRCTPRPSKRTLVPPNSAVTWCWSGSLLLFPERRASIHLA